MSERAPGWDAIEQALKQAFPGREPLHWGTNTLPGQDGIYGLSAYRSGGEWFFVTYGLSELFAKESDNLAVSGWGFELTMRTPADGPDPPSWPREILFGLGRSVFSTGRRFGPGHRVAMGQPITGGRPPTRLTAGAFTIDPVLGSIHTPNGSVDFLEFVGITEDELAQMKATSTSAVLDGLAATNPRLVTDPAR